MEGLYIMFGIAVLTGLGFAIVFYMQDKKESQKSHIKQ